MSEPQIFTVFARSHLLRSCKACRAPIEFYQNATTGRWMPFDPGVEIRRSFQREPDHVVCHEVAGVSHFITCPDAQQFRKTPAPKPPESGSLF